MKTCCVLYREQADGERSTGVPQPIRPANTEPEACEVVDDPPLRPNHTTTQLWRLVCTAQRHQGGARRAGDSREAVHTMCQSEHSTELESAQPPDSKPISNTSKTFEGIINRSFSHIEI